VKWFLYVLLGILALNLLVIFIVGVVLFLDWARHRDRRAMAMRMAGAARSSHEDRPPGKAPGAS
jgi:hypothetical protein